MIRLLTRDGVDPKVLDEQGMPALANAAIANDRPTVRTLIEAGAKPNWRDKALLTPLMPAALIDHGARPMADLLV